MLVEMHKSKNSKMLSKRFQNYCEKWNSYRLADYLCKQVRKFFLYLLQASTAGPTSTVGDILCSIKINCITTFVYSEHYDETLWKKTKSNFN